MTRRESGESHVPSHSWQGQLGREQSATHCRPLEHPASEQKASSRGQRQQQVSCETSAVRVMDGFGATRRETCAFSSSKVHGKSKEPCALEPCPLYGRMWRSHQARSPRTLMASATIRQGLGSLQDCRQSADLGRSRTMRLQTEHFVTGETCTWIEGGCSARSTEWTELRRVISRLRRLRNSCCRDRARDPGELIGWLRLRGNCMFDHIIQPVTDRCEGVLTTNLNHIRFHVTR